MSYCVVCNAMFEGVEGAACPNCESEIDKVCENLLFHEDGLLVQSEQPIYGNDPQEVEPIINVLKSEVA